MKYLINRRVALSRAPESPLVTYLDSFAGLLSAQKYALKSIHRQATWLPQNLTHDSIPDQQRTGLARSNGARLVGAFGSCLIELRSKLLYLPLLLADLRLQVRHDQNVSGFESTPRHAWCEQMTGVHFPALPIRLRCRACAYR